MRGVVKTIRQILGSRSRKLILPVVLTCVDSMLHMGMFSVMVLAIIQIISSSFTQQSLQTFTLILCILFVVRAVVYSINYTQTQYRGADITADLRLSLGNHIRSLNLGYFNKNSIGNLTSTLTTDISDFEQVLTTSISDFFKVLFFTVLALLFAFTLNWRYALMICVVILIALPMLYLSGKMAKKVGNRLRTSVHGVVSRVVEYINGIKTFKLYNLVGEKFKRLDNSFLQLKKDSIKLELSIMPFSILFSIITSLLIPLSIIVGTRMYQQGQFTIDTLIIAIMLGVSVSNIMGTLSSVYPQMKYLSKAAENMLQIKQEIPLEFETDAFACSSPNIAFNQVDFQYTENVAVLKNLSFTSKNGTTTAIIGPSGSGKSTIISLILRFWDVDKGSIMIDGKNIRTIAPDSLTSQMAVVFQDVYLLNDTIANNIRVGKPNATLEEIMRAAVAAQCHDFIMLMPNGYETVVGEGGSTLSGGEKQRISIARALIKDAPIVLLDESTSSLDADNEQEINRALDVLMQGKTVIVIAHRLNTIINADNILVLENGEIKEQGNHKQLMEQGGWYAKVIEEQSKAEQWVY